MAQLVTILWREIPSQVNVQAGRRRHQVQLSERFQHAIDRAAMVAGLDGSDDYLAQWRRVSVECDAAADFASLASETAAGLEADYPLARLNELVARGGVEAAAG